MLVVASVGNEQADLQHSATDDISPDWPPGSAELREVMNNCRVAPAELPGVMTVSATGPIGYPGYDLWIADYSSVGMSRVDVVAPGGDYFRVTDTVQDAILAATPIGGDIWAGFDPLNGAFPGITSIDGGAWLRLSKRHLDVVSTRRRGGRSDQGDASRLGTGCGQSGDVTFSPTA